MSEELKMLKAILEHLANQKREQHDCSGGCSCDCPTSDMFEGSAARYADRSSNVAAESMQSYSLQAAAQNAALIAMQGQITGLTQHGPVS